MLIGPKTEEIIRQFGDIYLNLDNIFSIRIRIFRLKCFYDRE